jgi:hypothetical protein
MVIVSSFSCLSKMCRSGAISKGLMAAGRRTGRSREARNLEEQDACQLVQMSKFNNLKDPLTSHRRPLLHRQMLSPLRGFADGTFPHAKY